MEGKKREQSGAVTIGKRNSQGGCSECEDVPMILDPEQYEQKVSVPKKKLHNRERSHTPRYGTRRTVAEQFAVGIIDTDGGGLV